MNKHIYIDTKIDDLVVSIQPKELNSKLPATILHKVSQKYGNKCYKDVGYILKNSIVILKNMRFVCLMKAELLSFDFFIMKC